MSRLGILISGRGSNFEAIADNVAAGTIPAEIAVVISNRAEARGLEAARRRGLNAVVNSIQRAGPRGLRPNAPGRAPPAATWTWSASPVSCACSAPPSSAHFPTASSISTRRCCPRFPAWTRSTRRWNTASKSADVRSISWTNTWTPARLSCRPRFPFWMTTRSRRSPPASSRRSTGSTPRRSASCSRGRYATDGRRVILS